MASYKELFIEYYTTYIKRNGATEFLEYLLSNNSDFFDAPCSTRFHGNYEGGLVEHSVHVFECLKDYLDRNRVKEQYNMKYSMESIALVSLLHDVCKIKINKQNYSNKKIDGQWKEVPYYEFDDPMPYGHGEKSVYMITPFMKLTREEAFAIRYHMGFSQDENPNSVGYTFEHFPLAFALSTADMEAPSYLDGKE